MLQDVFAFPNFFTLQFFKNMFEYTFFVNWHNLKKVALFNHQLLTAE